jgi:hypothetical protein
MAPITAPTAPTARTTARRTRRLTVADVATFVLRPVKHPRKHTRLHVPVAFNATGVPASILSHPTKMSINVNGKATTVYSFGLAAKSTCPGATYGSGHKCDECYATKGQYLRPSSRLTIHTRTQWTRESFKTPDGINAWLNVMRYAIWWATVRRNVFYFRIHHSGDFYSADYAKAWHTLISEFPMVRFWSPTSSHLTDANPKAIAKLAPIDSVLKDIVKLGNISLRPSPRMIGLGNVIESDGYSGGTGVVAESEINEYIKIFGTYADAVICDAQHNGNRCGDCTTCWDRPDINVYYLLH